ILILGMAYKKDVDDMRESPSQIIYEKIEALGAHVDFHDTHFPEIPFMRDHPNLKGRKSVAIDAKTLATYDAVIVATEHSAVDYALVAKHSKLVVDTRNAMRHVADRTRIVKA
ncbi:MAG: UDP-N-acetyl-D-glucosamine dehydrogenase, partial [Rickettsiales bacterium]|nr:UDP-N-acetyl-D-glucosamine dehydrogenase [Rickettsiales bacterium]